LGNLKLIYDDNHITIDGSTNLAFSEDVGLRFEAYGWHVQHVGDGNDLDAIALALDTAVAETTRPSLIILRTHIGDPAPTKRDTAAAHGSPLGAEEVAKTKAILGWPEQEKFVVAPEAAQWRARCLEKGRKAYGEWQALWDRYRREFPDLASEFTDWQAGRLPKNWADGLPTFTPADGKLATRQASAKTMNVLAGKLGNLIRGSRREHRGRDQERRQLQRDGRGAEHPLGCSRARHGFEPQWNGGPRGNPSLRHHLPD